LRRSESKKVGANRDEVLHRYFTREGSQVRTGRETLAGGILGDAFGLGSCP